MDFNKGAAGTSLLAIVRMLAPVGVVGAGMLIGGSAQAQSVCLPLVGTNILCEGGGPPANPSTPVLTPAPVTGPLTVTLGENFQSLTGVTLTTLGTAADVTIEALGNAAITTVNEPGLVINAAGDVTAEIDSVITQGTGATGVLIRAVDEVVFASDDLISTLGDAAPGLDIEGGSVTVDANVIETQGAGSNGAQLVALNGPVNLDADLIETSGDLSTAALLRAVGDVNLNVGVLQTQGSRALGIDIATDPAACVLLGDGGCDVTAAADQITTNGFGGIGALVSAATGDTTLNVDVLQTGGDEAAGLSLAADAAACAILGAGACDQNFTVGQLTTQGDRSPGALIRAAGNVTGDIRVLRTNGDDAVGLDLASSPDACVLLGAGNCGTSFNIGELTTSGAGATGVLARVAGPTVARIGVLETLGEDATGIDIAADPTACALLGSGACDVDLAADRVTTQGNGAAGVLVSAPASILANVGLVRTGGDNAPGVNLVTDPVLCLTLGAGACGITANVGGVDTGGENSPGVVVDGGEDPTDVTTGPVNTGGNNSPGVDVSGEGPIRVVTGPVTTGGDNSPGVVVDGGAGPITVVTGPVTTGGNNSDGIDVDGTGPITVNAGPIRTGGNGSSGIVIDGGAGPINVVYDDIITRGADSPGVDVSGGGPITIGGGSITTGGDRSDGVVVDGGAGPVRVTTGPIRTVGADSDGIDVTTDSGSQTIVAGPITVTGPGADGIVATSPGCSAIDITATGPIRSAQGTAILASSACSVSVTTLPGATISGQLAGIDVTSGTGATLTIGSAVSSGAGPAIDVDGAPTLVTITPTGSVSGYVDLTDQADRLVNNGRFDATANSNFGGGADSFANGGTLAVRPGAAAAGGVTLTGLESFANSGLIDLRNGVAGDTLTLPGTFTGTGASTLGLDLAIGATPVADRLIVGGAAGGSTPIALNSLGTNPGLLVNNLVLVDASAGSSANAFNLAGGPFTRGLVRYDLVFDPAQSNYALFGTPSDQVYELGRSSDGARQIFYRGNDAWSSHMRNLRDAGTAETDSPQRRGSALWGQIHGSLAKNRYNQTYTAFGQRRNVSLNNRQDFFGVQMGYDFGGVTQQQGSVFGITGGYMSSVIDFRRNADRLSYDAANIGAYASFVSGPLFLNLLGKYEHYWLKSRLPSAGVRTKQKGDGYGGKIEAGARLGGNGFFFEPNVALEYARTDIDGFTSDPSALDFDKANGLRGSAGIRLGTDVSSGVTRTSLYASGSVVHEFKGRDRFSLANNGQLLEFRTDRVDTFGRAAIGLNVATGDRVSGFIEASGDFGKGYRSGGGRAGLNVRF